MDAFAPCRACRRHVRVADRACPFCARPLEDAAPIASPPGRRSRAHFMLAAAALAGCSKTGDAPASADPQASASTVAASPVAPSASASSVMPLTSADLLAIGSVPSMGYSGLGMGAAYGAPPAKAPSPGTSRAEISDVFACAIPGADKVITLQRARFRTCYELALRGDPAIAGKLRLAMTVSAKGEVSNARVSSSTVPQMLASCATAVAKTLTFPESVAKCELAFTVTFSQ